MALDNETLKDEILDALTANLPPMDAKIEPEVLAPIVAYAEALSAAIHKYVRTGEVNVPGEGNKPVR